MNDQDQDVSCRQGVDAAPRLEAGAGELALFLQRELERERDRSERLAGSLVGRDLALSRSVIVSETDRSGAITFANEKFCEISGWRLDELLGRNHRILNSGLHPRSFWTAMYEALAADGIWRGEVCNRAKCGRLYWVDVVNTAIRDRTGRIERFVSVRLDITARKAAEESLGRARRDALDAEARAGEMLTVVEREIGPSLASARTELLALQRAPGAEAIAGRLAALERGVDRAARIVGDMATILRRRRCDLPTAAVEFDASSAIRGIAEMLYPLARAKGVELIVDPDGHREIDLRADAAGFRRVVIELTEDALHAVDQGYVALAFGVDDSDPDRPQFRCSVTDTRGGRRPQDADGIAVRDVVAALGGTIERETGREGASTYFLVPGVVRWQRRDGVREHDVENRLRRVGVAGKCGRALDVLVGELLRLGLGAESLGDPDRIEAAIRSAEDAGLPFSAVVVDLCGDRESAALTAAAAERLSGRVPRLVLIEHIADLSNRRDADDGVATLRKPLVDYAEIRRALLGDD